eukprot:jgi/Mesvir1/18483/Mv25472-RA.1
MADVSSNWSPIPARRLSIFGLLSAGGLDYNILMADVSSNWSPIPTRRISIFGLLSAGGLDRNGPAYSAGGWRQLGTLKGRVHIHFITKISTHPPPKYIYICHDAFATYYCLLGKMLFYVD